MACAETDKVEVEWVCRYSKQSGNAWDSIRAGRYVTAIVSPAGVRGPSL